MGRPKGIKNKAEKDPQTVPKPVYATETPADVPSVQTVTESPEKTVLARDAWRYHETESPRIFRAGSIVPEGWHDSQKKISTKWKINDLGKWSKA